MSNEIHDILAKLDRVRGVKGTGLLTDDGIMVASTLGEDFLEDVVAGLSSFLISTTRRSLREAELGGMFTRFVLNSTHGKVVMLDVGESFLVVITNQFADLGACLVEIQQAGTALRRAARIQI